MVSLELWKLDNVFHFKSKLYRGCGKIVGQVFGHNVGGVRRSIVVVLLLLIDYLRLLLFDILVQVRKDKMSLPLNFGGKNSLWTDLLLSKKAMKSDRLHVFNNLSSVSTFTAQPKKLYIWQDVVLRRLGKSP